MSGRDKMRKTRGIAEYDAKVVFSRVSETFLLTDAAILVIITVNES